MTAQEILQEFLNSNIQIKSKKILIKYINFCLYNSIINNIKYKSNYHHILPKALFSKYKNLNKNKWNGVHLLHKDHYYAHWLLSEAISDYGQLFGFCSMHAANKKIQRILKNDLICPELFQKKTEEKIIKYKKWCTDNPKKLLLRANKISNTLTATIYINNKKTSIAKYHGNNLSSKLNKTVLFEGNIITEAEKRGVLYSRSGKYFILKSVFDNKINIIMTALEVRSLNQSLINKTKDNYLGRANQAKSKLNNNNNFHLIGYYVEAHSPKFFTV